MSSQVSTAFLTLFDAEVKQAYQADAALRNCVRTRSGVNGSTYKFPKIGSGVATPRIPQTDVVPLNVDYSQVTATIADWNAAEYSDIFNQSKINFDERQELVQVVSKAIGRRHDQIIIDALTASATSLTVANDIGGTDTNLNVAKIREAKRLLDKGNVPFEDRFLVCHSNGLYNLLSETSAISTDFVNSQAMMTGKPPALFGFNIIVIGDRTEGGLTIDGSLDRTIWAFHKSSVGLAEGMSFKTEINYIPEKTSWLVNAMFSAGAIAIDTAGIVQITCRET